MITNKDGKERREFIRVGKNWHVVFQKLDRELNRVYRREIDAETRNASSGGILFRCSENIQLSSLIELEVQLPDENEPAVMIGKVVRVDENHNTVPMSYDVGVKFIWMHRNDAQRVNSAISLVRERQSDVREISSGTTQVM